MADVKDWLGVWDTSWDSPSGKFSGDFKIDHLSPLPGGGYDLSGRADSYTLSGTVTFVIGGNWTLQGKWTRVLGGSGGPCQYGQLSLTLTDSADFLASGRTATTRHSRVDMVGRGRGGRDSKSFRGCNAPQRVNDAAPRTLSLRVAGRRLLCTAGFVSSAIIVTTSVPGDLPCGSVRPLS